MAEEIGFSDFAEVASTKIDGDPPVIVGGQAVNVWALFYLPKIDLKACLPADTLKASPLPKVQNFCAHRLELLP